MAILANLGERFGPAPGSWRPAGPKRETMGELAATSESSAAEWPVSYSFAKARLEGVGLNVLYRVTEVLAVRNSALMVLALPERTGAAHQRVCLLRPVLDTPAPFWAGLAAKLRDRKRSICVSTGPGKESASRNVIAWAVPALSKCGR